MIKTSRRVCNYDIKIAISKKKKKNGENSGLCQKEVMNFGISPNGLRLYQENYNSNIPCKWQHHTMHIFSFKMATF